MNPDFSEGAEFYEKHLRTFPMNDPASEPLETPFFGSLPELFAAFSRTTGFELKFVRPGGNTHRSQSVARLPVRGDRNRTAGWLILYRLPERPPLVEAQSAVSLAESLAATLGEAYRWSFALREREAELAAFGHFSTVSETEHSTLRAHRLSMILKAGARAIGCEAAALYLLDPETTVLKLRSLWGLPEERLTESARPLAGAIADLEALLGNAVVLNESYLREEWNAPENFAASVCIPVASETSVLGTIWFFSDQRTDFCDLDLSVLSMVASQVAIELERTLLLAENRKYRRRAEECAMVAEMLRSRVDSSNATSDGWRFAAKSADADAPAATFCSWSELSCGFSALTIGGSTKRSEPAKTPWALCNALECAALLASVQTAAATSATLDAFQTWVKNRSARFSDGRTQTPVFRPTAPESDIFFLALLGRSSGAVNLVKSCGCRSVLFAPRRPDELPAAQVRGTIPRGGGMVAVHSSEEIPEKVASELIPEILESNARREAEDLLALLRHTIEKKGRCKNLTLFVVKSPNE